MRKSGYQFITLRERGNSVHERTVAPDGLEGFITAERKGGGTVCLTGLDSIPGLLAALGNRAIDRQTKHVSRELSLVLLGQKKFPVIRGSYADPVRALSSIRTFLKSAAEAGDRNFYFIGIDESILAGIRQQLGDRAAMGVIEKSLDADDSLPVSRDDDELARLFSGDSQVIRLFRHQLLQGIEDNGPVFLNGEVGTGKNRAAEFICRRIKGTSPVHLNGATLTRNQLDEQLRSAGYLRSKTDKAAANHPDAPVILDEVATLSPRDQIILRDRLPDDDRPAAIQRARAMLVLTTNRDLRGMIASQSFDEKLYYLLERFVVRVPSLAERPKDIPAIAQTLWRDLNPDGRVLLPASALKLLADQRWPGNVRELKTILIRLHRGLPVPRPDPKLLTRLLRAILLDAGRALRPSPRDELAATRAERLEHLRRCADTVHLCNTLVTQLAPLDSLRTASARRCASNLRQQTQSLATLCENPARFSGQSICLALQQISASLQTTADQFAQHPASALHQLRTQLAPRLAQIPAALLEETNRILRGI